jgi:YesN/AraC family two-component response regulator
MEGRQAILRVLIVDDSDAVRRGLTRLLQPQGDIEIIGESSDGQDAIRKTQQYKPDVVLMDVSMPVMNGLDAARKIKHDFPSTVVLMVTQFESASFAREAVSAGAAAYILKSDATKELIPALRKIQSSR